MKKSAHEEDPDSSSEEEEDTDLVSCSGSHCHKEIASNEIGEDSVEVFIKESIGSLSRLQSASLAQRLNFVRGPQINIENLHLDLSTKLFRYLPNYLPKGSLRSA